MTQKTPTDSAMSATDRRSFLAAGMAGALVSLVATREAGAAPSSRVVTEHDMPAVNLDGWHVTVSEVSYPPGEASNRHQHPGFVCGYVLEGQYRFGVEGQAPVVLTAGQCFFEMPGDVHAVSGNASTSTPAKILAMVFTPKTEPVTKPLPKPGL